MCEMTFIVAVQNIVSHRDVSCNEVGYEIHIPWPSASRKRKSVNN